jgi:hypothetical protein
MARTAFLPQLQGVPAVPKTATVLGYNITYKQLKPEMSIKLLLLQKVSIFLCAFRAAKGTMENKKIPIRVYGAVNTLLRNAQRTSCL